MVSSTLDIKTPGGETHRIDTAKLQTPTVGAAIAAVRPSAKYKSALLTPKGRVLSGPDPISEALADAKHSAQPARLSEELPAG